MGLSNRKEEQLKEMPIIKCSVTKSKDGRYVIQRTTMTWIKPTAYYEAVFSGKRTEDELEELAQLA